MPYCIITTGKGEVLRSKDLIDKLLESHTDEDVTKRTVQMLLELEKAYFTT